MRSVWLPKMTLYLRRALPCKRNRVAQVCVLVPKGDADLRHSRMLDQATGELEPNHHLTLSCSKCLTPCTHRVGWVLKACVFDFTRDFPTTLRALKYSCQTR